MVDQSFAYYNLKFENQDEKVGYLNAIFEVNGIEASKETISEAVEKGCEKAFTGFVTLKVQDKSKEGKSEEFTFNFQIDKLDESIK